MKLPTILWIDAEEYGKLTDTVDTLMDENKGLRWLLACLLKREGGEVVVTFRELTEVESDDVITMEQDVDKSWTIRHQGTIEIEMEGDG